MFIYARTHTHIHTLIYMYAHTHTHIHTLSVFFQWVKIILSIYIHTHEHTYHPKSSCVYIYTRTNTRPIIQTCHTIGVTHTYVRTYICMNIHINMHANILHSRAHLWKEPYIHLRKEPYRAVSQCVAVCCSVLRCVAVCKYTAFKGSFAKRALPSWAKVSIRYRYRAVHARQ